MKFLISTAVHKFRTVLGRGGDDASDSLVRFCPNPSDLASSSSTNSLDDIDVWICRGDEVTQTLLDGWVDGDAHSPRTLLVQDADCIPELERLSRGRLAEILPIATPGHNEESWVVSTLQTGEKLHARHLTRSCRAAPGTPPNTDAEKDVLLVGAGIMSLVAAEHLAVNGFKVRIVDASPDPRVCRDWTRHGVTNGGGNARMFTFTEADNYNESGSPIYHDMRYVCSTTVRDGGWSVKAPAEFSDAERAWVHTFEQIPAWLAQGMKKDIYYVNREAGKLWHEFMGRAPELFEGVSLHPNILRLYAEGSALTAAHELNEELGTVVDEFSLRELLREYPGFRTAAKSNEVAGGLVVQGFTLGIHSFVHNLIDRIERLGGEFTWDCSVQQICRNASGEVTSLESQQGSLQADNYVISTGVTRNGLLDGTASENLVQGVLGVWLQIPNLDPMMKKSIKIHRRGYRVEDINITVLTDHETDEDTLLLGGGYGYVGLDHPSPESPEMQALFNEIEEVARAFFPAGYRRAKERYTLWPQNAKKFCIRPFTCTGLGVFEDIPTASGGHLVVTGGNNTGGFAQSPAVARAIQRAMDGEHDPIHVLFNPKRSQFVA